MFSNLKLRRLTWYNLEKFRFPKYVTDRLGVNSKNIITIQSLCINSNEIHIPECHFEVPSTEYSLISADNLDNINVKLREKNC